MILKVKKEKVVRLFELLGYKIAKRWDEKKIQAKIKELSYRLEYDGVELKDSEYKKLLRDVLRADKVVFFKAGEVVPGKPASSKPKVKAKVKTKGKKEGKKKAAVVKSEVDRFGRRLGTQGALIDTVLGKKGKSVAAIAKETKLSVRRIHVHVQDLLEKGFLVKDKKDNYSVK